MWLIFASNVSRNLNNTSKQQLTQDLTLKKHFVMFPSQIQDLYSLWNKPLDPISTATDIYLVKTNYLLSGPERWMFKPESLQRSMHKFSQEAKSKPPLFTGGKKPPTKLKKASKEPQIQDASSCKKSFWKREKHAVHLLPRGTLEAESGTGRLGNR